MSPLLPTPVVSTSPNRLVSLIAVWCTVALAAMPNEGRGQASIKASLQRLDVNGDGEISPDEITPLARPYLERIAGARRMSLDRPNSVERFAEAARIYNALQNGAWGKDVRPTTESTVKPFGPTDDDPIVPEFGLGRMRFPYNQDDLEQAYRIMGRYDRNGDGYIDRAEAAQNRWTHRDPFEEDFNEDGRLSRMELTQRYARRRLLDDSQDEIRRQSWRSRDSERDPREQDDRRRSSSDWRRGGTRYYLTTTVMGRFDKNRNGRLEAAEAQSLGIPIARIDVNRDGELSRDELQAHLFELQDQAGDESQGLPGWFYELDANRDGQVEMAEYSQEWPEAKVQEFRSIDLNGDGLLTTSEVIRSKAAVGGTYTNEEAEVLPPRKSIISEIEVDDDFVIGDLNVQLSLTHTYVSQLEIYLTGPDGQRIELAAGIGGSGDNFEKTIFDDQSRYIITKARAPFEGSFMPAALAKRQPGLSHFNGKSVKGVWQLIIRGTRSERFGMLHGWGLALKPQEAVLAGADLTPENDGPVNSQPAAPSTVTEPAPSSSGSRERSPEVQARIDEYKRRWAEEQARRKERESSGKKSPDKVVPR